MATYNSFPILSAAEAAALIAPDATIAFSGFTAAGAAKAVPQAMAARAEEQQKQGQPYSLRVLTGASTGKTIDDALAQAGAIAWRSPFQSSKHLRSQINDEKVRFVDMHLSHLPQLVTSGFFGKLHYAVIEATEIAPDGRVYLSSSIGASPTYLQQAEKVIIEINHNHSMRTREMADIITVPPPPRRNPLTIHEPMSRIGYPYAVVDPKKVVGIVENNEPDYVQAFTDGGEVCEKIAGHVVRFLLDEQKTGRIPPEFLPLQAGVGNIANSVMTTLGENPDVPPFYMYSEVFQDGLVALMQSGKLLGASACSLTLTPTLLQEIYNNMDFFAPRIVLRPQELSNHPEVTRRLGVIAMNTALEIDIYGHVNSTHIGGTNLVNGIGGSGDFNRNSYLSIDMCPSITRQGRISTIVPMCTHVDNTEHSVQIVVTEQGLADLRGLGPRQRARKIINTCVHPTYRDYMNRYLATCPKGHLRHNLETCFELHRNLAQYDTMLP
ncbi:MAG: succinate CoA transferase [Deltaproteobacteria bacterium]|nr:succinate CoA transferase [Deltaproteobacteria bacterium]